MLWSGLDLEGPRETRLSPGRSAQVSKEIELGSVGHGWVKERGPPKFTEVGSVIDWALRRHGVGVPLDPGSLELYLPLLSELVHAAREPVTVGYAKGQCMPGRACDPLGGC